VSIFVVPMKSSLLLRSHPTANVVYGCIVTILSAKPGKGTIKITSDENSNITAENDTNAFPSLKAGIIYNIQIPGVE
jgi:hypothetical protein